MLEVELKVLEGRQQGKTIPLHVRQFLIGREQDCHLRPNSDLVSRHHCVFTLDDFALRLRDLGSTNGTFVNGERIQGQVVLKAGDHVNVGKLAFEIVVKETARVATPVAAKVAGPSSSVLSSSAPATPPAEPGVDSTETSLNVTDTVELPATAPQDDTAILDTFQGGEAATQQAGAQQSGFMPPGGYPQQGYGMPQGYAMPGYPPGYPAGYPGGYPGYPPPGYGAPPGYMQPGYGMQPMMPMPGYGMPQTPEQQPAAANRTAEPPPVVLPDPEQTGAKAPAAPPPPPPPVEGQAVDPASSKNPSDAAADIIRSHRSRRPT
jgi:predicted component of type VI protein secretion system